MTRILQLSLVIVALLVARQVFYAWLKQPDQLGRHLRQGLNALVAYFVYVMIGLLIFSRVAGWGFGEHSAPAALVLMLGGALYVGVGVGALWAYLGKNETRRRR